MRAKYQPLVQYVGDRQELLNLLNEMIGELNASHTGAAPPQRGPGAGVSTGHLGIELEPDKTAGLYRVTHIYESGPADKDWVKVSVGDHLLAINGKQVKAGDEYWQLLNNRLNRKSEVTFNSKPIREFRDKEALVIDQRWNGGATSSRNCLQSWCSVNTRSGSRAALNPLGDPLPDSSGPRWCCRTGARLRMLKCFRQASGHLV